MIYLYIVQTIASLALILAYRSNYIYYKQLYEYRNREYDHVFKRYLELYEDPRMRDLPIK